MGETSLQQQKNMRLLIAVVAFALLAAVSNAVPSSGMGSCFHTTVCNPRASDCLSGQCCNGACVSSSALPTIAIGETCSNNFCSGRCLFGTSCEFGMCQRSITTLGEGCVCGSEGRGCGSGLVCDFAVNRTLSENVGRPNGLPAGSSCVIDDQCVGTCTNGVCDGSDTGDTCFSSDTCNPPNKCVYVDQSTFSRQCLSQRTPGGWCVQDADCTSNLCDNSNNVCVERASIAAGALLPHHPCSRRKPHHWHLGNLYRCRNFCSHRPPRKIRLGPPLPSLSCPFPRHCSSRRSPRLTCPFFTMINPT